MTKWNLYQKYKICLKISKSINKINAEILDVKHNEKGKKTFLNLLKMT